MGRALSGGGTARGVEGASNYFVDERWCSWSSASICAERRAWSAVAAGEARSRSKEGIIACMRAWPSSVRRLSGKQVWMICRAMCAETEAAGRGAEEGGEGAIVR